MKQLLKNKLSSILNIFNYPKYVFIGLILSFILYSLSIYLLPLFSNNHTNNQDIELSNKGRLVWQQNNCHTCHQLYGLGGYLGPDLTNVFSRTGENELYIKGIITSGVKQMPAFNLNEKEMKALISFLKNIDTSGTADVQKYSPEITGTFNLETK